MEVAFLKSIAGNPFEGELRALGIPVTGLGARNLRDVRAFRRLLALLRRGRFDLVHAHLAYATLWGLAAGRLAGIPVVSSLHTVPPLDPPWSREGVRRRLLVLAANRRAARVTAVSDAVRRAWVEEAGLAPERVEVVHNGVAAPTSPEGGAASMDGAARVRGELGIPRGVPVATAVSVLRPGKGLEVLLDAVPAIRSAVPRVRVVIAGDGPLRTALEARAAASGAGGAVVWGGFRRDVPALLAASDLVVVPSLDDAFPTVALEAMSAGRPVVASRTGGIPEIVADGDSGRLVPPGDPEALARAVTGLLADPEERWRLGAAGRERHRELFSTEAWLARLEAVYGEVLGRPVRLQGEAGSAPPRETPGSVGEELASSRVCEPDSAPEDAEAGSDWNRGRGGAEGEG
ncbi:MAG: glycosyltransferase family 4 protein [Thermoanaerobaculia bacterium]